MAPGRSVLHTHQRTDPLTTVDQPVPGASPGTKLMHTFLGGPPRASFRTGESATVAARLRDGADELDSIQKQLQARPGYVIDQLRRITEGRARTRHGSTDGVR